MGYIATGAVKGQISQDVIEKITQWIPSPLTGGPGTVVTVHGSAPVTIRWSGAPSVTSTAGTTHTFQVPPTAKPGALVVSQNGTVKWQGIWASEAYVPRSGYTLRLSREDMAQYDETPVDELWAKGFQPVYRTQSGNGQELFYIHPDMVRVSYHGTKNQVDWNQYNKALDKVRAEIALRQKNPNYDGSWQATAQRLADFNKLGRAMKAGEAPFVIFKNSATGEEWVKYYEEETDTLSISTKAHWEAYNAKRSTSWVDVAKWLFPVWVWLGELLLTIGNYLIKGIVWAFKKLLEWWDFICDNLNTQLGQDAAAAAATLQGAPPQAGQQGAQIMGQLCKAVFGGGGTVGPGGARSGGYLLPLLIGGGVLAYFALGDKK